MAHLYALNTARKLRFIATLFSRGSKRILGLVDSSPANTFRKVNTASMFDITLQTNPIASGPIQDAVYYKHSDAGYCVFQVENTLFKLHRVLLTREPSVFGDMFSLAQPDDTDGTSNDIPVFLSDTLEQFRDFLWALYASHTELYNETQINRLLNIAELTSKYCFASLEGWVLERIYVLSQGPTGLLRPASPDVCARMLKTAILGNHKKLLNLVTQHIICQILWYNTYSEAIIEIAETYGLRALQGAGYYRRLIDMESFDDNSDMIELSVPLTMSAEQRTCFLSAHHSLLNLWDHLRTCPPTLFPSGCLAHNQCSTNWERMWFEAGAENERLCCGSADVLGRLKAVMLSLRKSMCDAPGLTLQCKMTALEAITALRDEIIDGLMDHFMGNSN
ncbi:hypothetical protein L208DRAFT_289166 [Tricholoma matsutake]|nr:hypothetical protein L208DRAFT_289166 [Tricholoma matsutake 945]